jgi:predicted HD superfamily hydrolase involved in NAD metabolism
MSDKRRRHTEGVRNTALSMARKWGADVCKAERAALYHDIYRGVQVEELNRMVAELGLDAERYMDNANLAHGKLAAAMIPSLFGEEDEDVINAVSFHTTGRPGMSLLEKIIFLADAIEPGRDYTGVTAIREAAEKDLDLGCLKSLTGTIRHLREQGMDDSVIDPDTLNAAKYFEELLEKKYGKQRNGLAGGKHAKPAERH